MCIPNWFSVLSGRISKLVQRARDAVRGRRHDVRTAVDTMEDRCLLSAPHPFDLGSLTTGDGTVGTVFNGIAAGDQSGYSARTAGDINGDGFDDFVIGAYRAIGEAQGPLNIGGEAYVVFGTPVGLPAEVNLSSLNGTNGFRIPGQDDRTAIGLTVGSVGDVNGDGFHDLFIDGYNADHPNRVGNNGRRVGEAYVIFGRSEAFPAVFDTDTLDGSNGFTLAGTDDFDQFGLGGFAGDVNGDGFDDIVVSAVNRNTTVFKEVYVIYGKAQGFGRHIFVADLDGTDGFTIPAINSQDRLGRFPSKAGDMNGDGYADIIFGASRSDLNGEDSGAAYVMFGRPDPFPSSFDLASLDGTNGFQIRGIEAGDWAGERTQFLGDINGDGFHDVGVGADRSDSDSGEAYVIFGAATGFPAVLELSSLNGTNGVKFVPIDPGDQLGISISTVGDLDGDGLDDLGLGAQWADRNGEDRVGEVYIVFGTPTGWTATYDLTSLDGDNGFRLDGVAAGDVAGKFVNTAGDFNGDGFSELLIGANGADPGGNSLAGRTYLIYGSDFRNSVTHAGDEGDNTLVGDASANIMIGGRGDDLLRGNGGADVLRGGQGNDVLGITDLTFRRIDGGLGHDTLSLDGGGMVVDLNDINDARLTSIETIDISGSGDNALTVSVLDVLNISDTSNTLLVRRNDGDVVNIGNGWTQQADEVIGLAVFEVFTAGQAILKVQDAQAVVSTVSLSVSATAGTEADMTEITVTLTGDRTVFSDQTVDLVVTGSGITAGDYTLTDGDGTKPGVQIEIASGTMSGSVTFTVADDGLVENVETATLTIENPTLSLVIGNPNAHDITITSDDVPGFTVTETATDTTVTEAAGASRTDTFSVVLDAQPASDVVVDLANGDTSELSLDAAQLTFTSANWNVPQVVTVTGVDEATVDGNQISTVTVSINDAGSDDAYDNLPDQILSVTTIDDDVAGLLVVESDGDTIVDETGTMDSFEVSLTGQPQANVVLDVSNSDFSELTIDRAVLTFTPANWNLPQTVTVTGVDDSVVDGDQTTGLTISVDQNASDDAFDAIPNRILNAVTVDDDANFIVTESDGSTRVAESGTTDDIEVVLKAEPPGNVVLTVTVDDATEVSANTSNLVFTPADWNVPQVVIVTGIDDPTVDGDVSGALTFAVDTAASDPAFVGVPPQSVDVTTTDDDIAGFSISETGGGTIVEESGTADTFSVVLDARPLTDVVFSVSSSDAGEAQTDVTSLTFTPANWDVAQPVRIIGQDEVTVDGDQQTTITISVNAADSDDAFDPLPDQTLFVTTIDDDLAGFALSPAAVVVTEAGSSATVDVVLTAQPLSDVVLTVNMSDGTEAAVDRLSVTFSPANWSAPQALVVTGVDDPTVDGDRLSSLNVAVDLDASDAAFGSLPTQSVAVTTTDDDLAGFSIVESGGTTRVSEDGTSDTVRVSLSSQPLTPVVLTVTESRPGEVVSDQMTLTFTPADWNQEQLVTVTGVDDDIVDARQRGDLEFRVDAAASDDAFDPLPAQTIVVLNDDNDAATVTISDVVRNEGDGGSTDFTFLVTLDTEVDVPVVVDFSTQDGSATRADNDYTSRTGSLTFPAGSPPGHMLPVTVSVTGDRRVETDESFFVQLSNVQAVGRNVTIFGGQGTATIQNEDSADLSISSAATAETNGGTTTAVFEVRLNASVDVPVTVSFTTADGSALVADNDYNPTSGVLTFPENGLPGATQTVEVSIRGDSLVERDESFLVRLSGLSAMGRDVSSAEPDATGTIVNDDSATVSIANAAAVEGDTGSSGFVFEVVLNGEVDVPVAIDARTIDGTATVADGDYAPLTNTAATFAASTGSGTQTVYLTVPVFGDAVTERDETFSLELSQLTAGGRAVTFSSGNATLAGEATIINDDGAQISINDAVVVESDSGTTTATFTVSLSGRMDADLLVDYTTVDGTAATSDADYVASSGTLVFPGNPAVAVQTATIAIVVNGDEKVELDESFFVSLSPSPVVDRDVQVSDGTGSASITNDDNAAIRIMDVTQAEGDSGTTAFVFDVVLDGEVDVPVGVRYATESETARPVDNDFAFTSGSLTFDAIAGSTQQTRQISVSVTGDIKVESTESFLVNLTQITAGNRDVTFADSQGRGTILDEDEASVAIGDAAVNEGHEGLTHLKFDITLNGVVDTPVSVQYETIDDTANGGTDYIGRSGTISFAANAETETQTVSLIIQVIGDEVVELHETMFVQLSDLVSFGRVTLDDGSGRGSLLNDDVASLTVRDVVVVEGDAGNPTAVLHVSLDYAVDVPFTVDVSTADGTAHADDDYAAVSGTVTFSGAQSELQTLSVPITDDFLEEATETFFVDFGNVQAAGRAVSLKRERGTVTVVDNDGPALDVDGNGTADAATDGILIVRYLFGFQNEALTDGAVGDSAVRDSAADVMQFLTTLPQMLDVDGNGVQDAATDGILILRYLFGFRGDALVDSAIGTAAVRTTGVEIAAFLDGFNSRPPVPPPPAFPASTAAPTSFTPVPVTERLAAGHSESARSTQPQSFLFVDRKDGHNLFESADEAQVPVAPLRAQEADGQTFEFPESTDWLDVI